MPNGGDAWNAAGRSLSQEAFKQELDDHIRVGNLYTRKIDKELPFLRFHDLGSAGEKSISHVGTWMTRTSYPLE